MIETDLYLASKSPRRRELLQQIGVRFDVLSVDVEEVHREGELPKNYVSRLAADKSVAGWSRMEGSAPVLGADTVVVLGDQILEKPADEEEAIDMLLTLSGRTHRVMTAIALHTTSGLTTALTETEVRFGDIDRKTAAAYWQTGEPKDKAGGYGIQGKGAVFVTHISGSYSNVVGLPLRETAQLLAQAGIRIWHTEQRL